MSHVHGMACEVLSGPTWREVFINSAPEEVRTKLGFMNSLFQLWHCLLQGHMEWGQLYSWSSVPELFLMFFRMSQRFLLPEQKQFIPFPVQLYNEMTIHHIFFINITDWLSHKMAKSHQTGCPILVGLPQLRVPSFSTTADWFSCIISCIISNLINMMAFHSMSKRLVTFEGPSHNSMSACLHSHLLSCNIEGLLFLLYDPRCFSFALQCEITMQQASL